MLLYHYCSTDTFVKIINDGSIRLSMLSMSNDHLEGRWMRSVFEREFDRLEISDAHFERVMGLIDQATDFVSPAGFCLSEEGDQLSQWRGYADDGNGFAIGFQPDYLRALGKKYLTDDQNGFALHKVIYDYDEYRELVETIVEHVTDALGRGAFRNLTLLEAASPDADKIRKSHQDATTAVLHVMFPLILHCHIIKNPAFKEEQEWRLLSMMRTLNTDDLSVAAHCKFAAAGNRVVPYRQIDLHSLDVDPIGEIVVGPRNISREDYLRAFLESRGLDNVEVRKSSASYR